MEDPAEEDADIGFDQAAVEREAFVGVVVVADWEVVEVDWEAAVGCGSRNCWGFEGSCNN